MNQAPRPLFATSRDSWVTLLDLVMVLLIVRLVVLVVSPFNLGPDEAQYWSWSLEPAFGYFSKPPMIAWVIGATTAIFGHAEWAIRVGSPFLNAVTALLLFHLGRTLYSGTVGLLAGLAFSTLPAAFLATALVSTDTPLLFFWSAALVGLVGFERKGDWRSACLMGLGIGLGMMSKYAMIYFVLCLALYLAMVPERRKLILNPRLWAAFVIAGLIVLPNVLWNMQSGFATVTHTAANANWQGDMFNPDRMADFLIGQLGVFGPVLFPAFLVGTFLAIRGRRALDSDVWAADRLLLFFSLPILAVATMQGFLSRANANWAATTYIAATLFTVSFLVRTRPRWLTASFALHLAIGAWFYLLVAVPGLIEATGASNAFKRVRGWDMIGEEVLAEANKAPYSAIMGDDRLITAELLYYARPRELPMTYWDADMHPVHHYELTIPLLLSQGARVLLVSRYSEPRDMLEHFEKATFLRKVTVTTGVGKSQSVYLFDLVRYKGRGEVVLDG